MMGAAHTPGPWVVSAVTQTEVIGPLQRTICRAHRDAPTRSEEETRANARLIAAAPELYEAAREAFDLIDRLPDNLAWDAAKASDMLRAALAKARGEQLA